MNQFLREWEFWAAEILSRARDADVGPWNFWNGVRTVFSTLAFVALVCACLLRENSVKP